MQYSELILTACLIGFLWIPSDAGRGEMEGNYLMSERGGGMGRRHGDMMRNGYGGMKGGDSGTGSSSSSNSMAGAAGNPDNFGVTKASVDNRNIYMGTTPGYIMYGTSGGSGITGKNTGAGSGSKTGNIGIVRPTYPRMPLGNPETMGPRVNNMPGGIVY